MLRNGLNMMFSLIATARNQIPQTFVEWADG